MIDLESGLSRSKIKFEFKAKELKVAAYVAYALLADVARTLKTVVPHIFLGPPGVCAKQCVYTRPSPLFIGSGNEDNRNSFLATGLVKNSFRDLASHHNSLYVKPITHIAYSKKTTLDSAV